MGIWTKSLHAMSFLLWCLTRKLTLRSALHHMPRKWGTKLRMLCSFPYWIKSAHLMGQKYNRMLYPNLKKVLDLFVKIWDLSWGFKIDGSFCKVYVVFSVGENVWLVSCIEQSVFYFFFPSCCPIGEVLFLVLWFDVFGIHCQNNKNQWNLVLGKLSHCRVGHWWGHCDCLNCAAVDTQIWHDEGFLGNLDRPVRPLL